MLNENAIKFNEIVADKEYRERVIKYFRLPVRLSVSEEKFLSDLDFISRLQKALESIKQDLIKIK